MIYQSIGPKNEGDALLVENSFVVAALYLQTHNQILPRAFQIHGHHYLTSRYSLRSHLTPAHQHRRESHTNALFLSDRHYLIAVRPVSSSILMSVISSDSSLTVWFSLSIFCSYTYFSPFSMSYYYFLMSSFSLEYFLTQCFSH